MGSICQGLQTSAQAFTAALGPVRVWVQAQQRRRSDVQGPRNRTVCTTQRVSPGPREYKKKSRETWGPQKEEKELPSWFLSKGSHISIISSPVTCHWQAPSLWSSSCLHSQMRWMAGPAHPSCTGISLLTFIMELGILTMIMQQSIGVYRGFTSQGRKRAGFNYI